MFTINTKSAADINRDILQALARGEDIKIISRMSEMFNRIVELNADPDLARAIIDAQKRRWHVEEVQEVDDVPDAIHRGLRPIACRVRKPSDYRRDAMACTDG